MDRTFSVDLWLWLTVLSIGAAGLLLVDWFSSIRLVSLVFEGRCNKSGIFLTRVSARGPSVLSLRRGLYDASRFTDLGAPSGGEGWMASVVITLILIKAAVWTGVGLLLITVIFTS